MISPSIPSFPLLRPPAAPRPGGSPGSGLVPSAASRGGRDRPATTRLRSDGLEAIIPGIVGYGFFTLAGLVE